MKRDVGKIYRICNMRLLKAVQYFVRGVNPQKPTHVRYHM